ncbi:MAG TPA: hypothetical protein VMD03_09170 [Steroidobacteraceae bacterium]|nr:hypothetical protein [Steroidobacteraceae bacterium]
MRKAIKRNAGATALGALVLGSTMFGATAHADVAAHKLVLSGYADGAEGEHLLAGKYAAVIERLGAHGAAFAGNEVAASTNLCVAYIMTHSWKAADGTCDEAVREARLDLPDPTIAARLTRNEEVAIAYSNRAVLKMLEGRSAGAADDLARARSLSRSPFVTQNLSAVNELGATVAAATHG